MANRPQIQPRALVRASGGPRYAVAVAVDSLGTGLLRPFLLLYGVTVLRLSAPTTGIAMTAASSWGSAARPRWADGWTGAHASTAVAASMLVRVVGVALLLTAPAAGHVWLFAAAALFLGIGNQAWPAAHAALVATVAHGRERDAALAAGRAVRNAGLGAGALLATACLAGGTPPCRRWRPSPGSPTCGGGPRLVGPPPARSGPSSRPRTRDRTRAARAPRMRRCSARTCLRLLPQRPRNRAPSGPGDAAARVPGVVGGYLRDATRCWWSPCRCRSQSDVPLLPPRRAGPRRRDTRRVLPRLPRGHLTGPRLGCPGRRGGVRGLHHRRDHLCRQRLPRSSPPLAPAHVLGRALARFQLSTGFGLAISPAVITALASHGPAALWAASPVRRSSPPPPLTRYVACSRQSLRGDPGVSGPASRRSRPPWAGTRRRPRG